jgi:hypothetical protein
LESLLVADDHGRKRREGGIPVVILPRCAPIRQADHGLQRGGKEGDMQGQLIIADARVLLPQCHCCNAPMRIRTIDVVDRQEQIKLACTACGTEMMQTYRFGK